MEGSLSQQLQELKNELTNISDIYPACAPSIKKLKAAIDGYITTDTMAQPELGKELDRLIDSLSAISPEDAKQITDSVKKSCKECMFHIDDCIINIIYILFKSVEIGEHLEFQKIRPGLRMDGFKKIMKKIQSQT
ncbi:MAG: hypothetical protein ACM3YE_10930 [Bacteroidota bacterium]